MSFKTHMEDFVCLSIPGMSGTPPGSEANAEEAPHFKEARVNALLRRRRRSRRRTRCHLGASSPPCSFVRESIMLTISVI